MRVIRHPEVPQELEAAALWYKERQAGLGEALLVEYQGTLSRILRDPGRPRAFRGDNRKLKFHHFPYAIIYSVRADELYIKAVMRLHRRPFYWAHRSPS